MKYWLAEYNTVPQGGFRYTDLETSMVIAAASWKELLLKAKAHRRSNALPIALSFDEDVENQLAAILPENQRTTENPNRSAEVPRAEWPMWAKALAMLAKPEDVGIGHIIERVVGPVGGDAFKRWYKETYGRDCGCSIRRDDLSALYPLKTSFVEVKQL